MGYRRLAPYKTDYKTLIPYLTRGLEKAGVTVYLNTEVTPTLVEQKKPDAVVVATGAVPNNLNIHVPVGGPSVVQANDVIAGRVAVGQRVVVVGGRYVGMEVADLLAEEGKHVSLIEAVELGWGTILGLKAVLRNRLVEKGVYIYPHSPLMRITKTGVDVANNGAILHLKADTVVLAIGTRPVNHLLEEIKNLVPEAYAIGDCTEIGDAMEAINQGAEIGRLI